MTTLTRYEEKSGYCDDAELAGRCVLLGLHSSATISPNMLQENWLTLLSELCTVWALDLAFDTKRLRQLCEDEAKAKLHLGAGVAKKLWARLADLLAASSVNDLVAGQPRLLDEAEQRRMVVNLSDGFRMVFCANHNKVPVSRSGAVDWTKVSRVKILWIGNDHE